MAKAGGADFAGDMAVARYRLRVELRSNWRFIVVSALILGVATAISLTALAGARRTSTVFDRLATATHASEVMVLPESAGAANAVTAAKLEAIPGVDRVAGAIGFFAARPDGTLVDSTVLAPIDDRFDTTMYVPVIREGRAADPSKADEITATPAGAKGLGLHIGDAIDLVLLPQVNFNNVDQFMSGGDPSQLQKLGVLRTFRLVGIGIRIDEASDPSSAAVFFTKAFYDAVKPGTMYTGYAVDLADGSKGIPALEAAVNDLAPGEPISFSTELSARETIERDLTPQVLALTTFAIVMAAAAAAAWALVAGRRTRVAESNDRALRALGMTRRARLMLESMRAVIVGAIAACLAVVIGYFASATMPLTEAWRIEPRRGLDLDGLVLFGGALILFVVTVIIGLLVSPRVAVRQEKVRDASRVDRVIRRSVSSPTISTGLSNALEVGQGESTMPVRSALIGATAGLAVIVAVLTFARSFSSFISTPRSFGWGYSMAVEASDVTDQEEEALFTALSNTLDSSPRVRGWAIADVLQAAVDGKPVALMAVEQRDGVAVNPTIVRGRPPAARDEVDLGERTARDIHASIGSVVDIGMQGHEHNFTVVGFAVMPGISTNSLDAAALGSGALLTADGMTSATGVQLQSSNGKVIIDLEPGTTATEFRDELLAAMEPVGLANKLEISGPGLPTVFDNPVEPREVVAFRSVQSTPVILALALSLLAAITVGYAIVASIRRRRHDLGTLQALGFTSRQVRATVAWHATTVALVATAFGVPIGVVIGRQAWIAIARQIGVVDHSVVPWLVIALALPITIAAMNFVAALPGRTVASESPAEVLSGE